MRGVTQHQPPRRRRKQQHSLRTAVRKRMGLRLLGSQATASSDRSRSHWLPRVDGRPSVRWSQGSLPTKALLPAALGVCGHSHESPSAISGTLDGTDGSRRGIFGWEAGPQRQGATRKGWWSCSLPRTFRTGSGHVGCPSPASSRACQGGKHVYTTHPVSPSLCLRQKEIGCFSCTYTLWAGGQPVR